MSWILTDKSNNVNSVLSHLGHALFPNWHPRDSEFPTVEPRLHHHRLDECTSQKA